MSNSKLNILSWGILSRCVALRLIQPALSILRRVQIKWAAGICVPILISLFFPAHGWSLNKDTLASIRLLREKGVRATTQRLVNSIISKNLDGIIALIGDPFMCGDAIISTEKILADLRNNESSLYVRLFDTRKYQEKHRGKTSLSDYFKGHEIDRITVSFLEGDDKTAFDVAEVYFSYDIDFLFQFEDNKWFLIEGLYDCP